MKKKKKKKKKFKKQKTKQGSTYFFLFLLYNGFAIKLYTINTCIQSYNASKHYFKYNDAS